MNKNNCSKLFCLKSLNVCSCCNVNPQNGANVNAGDGNGDTALHWAAYKSEAACVKLLLQKGADVNARDFNHDTPLSWCARKGMCYNIQDILSVFR